MLTRQQFLKESSEYYNKHGNALWLNSKYHTEVTQVTHNQVIARYPRMCFADMYYVQYIKTGFNKPR